MGGLGRSKAGGRSSVDAGEPQLRASSGVPGGRTPSSWSARITGVITIVT